MLQPAYLSLTPWFFSEFEALSFVPVFLILNIEYTGDFFLSDHCSQGSAY
jgi:hypothetical protein